MVALLESLPDWTAILAVIGLADPLLVLFENPQGSFEHLEIFFVIECRISRLYCLGNPSTLLLNYATRLGDVTNGHFEQRLALSGIVG